jgi:uncharacterized protein YbjT (DUF2867 family)
MTASDAFREWAEERTGITQSVTGTGIAHAAFLAGYRRALEDAAKEDTVILTSLYGTKTEFVETRRLRDRAGSRNNGGRDE